MNPKQAVEKLLSYNWSAIRIAKECGISRATVYRLLDDDYQPKFANVVVLLEKAKTVRLHKRISRGEK